MNFRLLIQPLVLPLACLVALAFTVPNRAADDRDESLALLVSLLGESEDPAFQTDVLQGLSDALEGRRDVDMPAGWQDVYRRLATSSDENVRRRCVELALIFKDRDAVDQLCKLVCDQAGDQSQRRQSLRLLVEHRADGLAAVLKELLDDDSLRGDALLGLAAYPTSETPQLVIAYYRKVPSGQREGALATLASRPEFALKLLDAVERGEVPSHDISTVLARQLARLEDERVNQRLREVWGEVRQPSETKRELIQEYKSWLTAETLALGDPTQGRLLFERTCQQCHMLYGQGGKIGPDITGSDRANLDYILENVLDPSAAVPREYRLTTIVTDEGRVISGLVQPLPNGVLAVQTPTERVLVPQASIEERRESTLSMMPDGLFDNLTRDQIRDLILYLSLKR